LINKDERLKCRLAGGKPMKFTKMHGLGNDYVYVDCTEQELKNPSEISKLVSDRHFGIGSDGLILIKKSDKADFYMDMYNADGSSGEMCGNGIRCVAKYVYDNHLTKKDEISVETLAGIKYLKMTIENGKVSKVRVDMGEPLFSPEQIPVLSDKNPVIKETIEVCEKKWEMTCVSMGNPHAVVFLDSPVKDFPLEKVGPCFENHPKFPRRVNTEFARILDRNTIEMRVWERGSGETLACGTGACATAVAAILNQYCERNIMVHLLGGELEIEWNPSDHHVYMTGPAVTVFYGEI